VVSSTINLATYRLTFADEFDGSSLNKGIWGTSYWWEGRYLASNGELQYFTDETTDLTRTHADTNPFYLEGGLLNIVARPSPDTGLSDGQAFTSGLITSFGTFSQQYGYFEIRAQLPSGQGLWPAFWLLPASGAWPPEIDVMEMLGGNTSTYYGSAHWGTTDQHQYLTQAITSSGLDLSSDFHTYGVSWEDDYIAWYLDGNLVYAWSNPPADFDQPMYLLAGLMVGGTWGGAPDASTQFPANLTIDHIRVYSSMPRVIELPATLAMDSDAWSKVIVGGARNDKLKGTHLAELLDGKAGSDTMTGGKGDDTYVVDIRSDLVVERAGEGTDTILTSLSALLLPANVENLSTTSSTGSRLTGNNLDNVVRGSFGQDVIDGAGGADILYGGDGVDVFVLRKGETAGDRIMDFGNGDLIRLEGFGEGAKLFHHHADLWSVSWSGDEEVFRIAGFSENAVPSYLFA
jgi:beta-glucanase (GH16 family)